MILNNTHNHNINNNDNTHTSNHDDTTNDKNNNHDTHENDRVNFQNFMFVLRPRPWQFEI